MDFNYSKCRWLADSLWNWKAMQMWYFDLLTFFASQGHKPSLEKLQYCSTEAKHLGHLSSTVVLQLSTVVLQVSSTPSVTTYQSVHFEDKTVYYQKSDNFGDSHSIVESGFQLLQSEQTLWWRYCVIILQILWSELQNLKRRLNNWIWQ